MKFIKCIGFFALLSLVLFSSCRKDEIFEGKIPGDFEPEVIVNGSISGEVLDEDNNPLTGVNVTLGTYSLTTDENGYFYFENIDINTKGSLITAEKDGYFYNAKFVGSRLNKLNFTQFKMIDNAAANSFSATDGTEIMTEGDIRILFPANGIKLESGDSYDGNVNVSATWIDPLSVDLPFLAPGDFRALDKNNNKVQLVNYGIIGVELINDIGQELNIADGKTARIEMPIPAGLGTNAPATLALWHLDEATGYWMEEGEATLEGGKYVAEVSHFSFWSFSVPFNNVSIDGLITDQSGTALSRLWIKVRRPSNYLTAWGMTDEDGRYGGPVPADMPLTLEVLNLCGELLHTQSIGPFSSDETVPTISVTINTLPVLGSLATCDLDVIENGYVKISHGTANSYLRTDANGNISGTIQPCTATEVSVTAYNLDDWEISSTETYDISSLTTLDLGQIVFCDDPVEFFNFEIDGVSAMSIDPSASYNSAGGFLTIEGGNYTDAMNNHHCYMQINATTPGTFNPSVVENGITIDGNGIGAACGTCSDLLVSIDVYGAVGEWVEGSYSGTVDYLGETRTVSAEFKIIREQ